MSQGLYSGVSGLALGTGLYRNTSGLWSGASGLAAAFGAGGFASLALDLNLLSGPLDPRITFSRGSQATLTDSTGKITYAPNNLLTNSESFEAAAWTKSNVTVAANTAVAPDGSTTSDKLVEAATTGAHYTYQGNGTVGRPEVFSVYAKAAERSWTCLQIGSNGIAYFNLSSGVTGTVSNCTAAITSVGNGWYRCSVYATRVGNSDNIIYPASANGSVSYAGDGTSGIYIWGAQLEQVTYQTTPGTYNSTTPKNLLGYTQEFDNAAWTKSNAFVQTNLATYSQDFTNAAWTKQEMTVTGNAAVAPDGTTTASNCVPTTLSSTHQISSGALVASSACVISIYAKNNGYNTIEILDRTAAVNGASFNLTTGAVTNIGTGVGSAVAVGGGWYRCSVAVTTTGMRIYIPSSSSTFSGNGTSGVLLWGAQLVQGSTAGDYQPTYAAAAAVQYVAPDGSRTADKLVENTAASTTHWTNQSFTGVNGAIYTYSVYAKAAERNWIAVQIGSGIFADGLSRTAYVNLSTGALGTISNAPTMDVVSIGNGWWRIAMKVTATASGAAGMAAYISNGDNGASYTGDGTSGIYIWGAQLSNSASVDPYVYNPGAAPTSAAYYGPRFDYNPVTLAAKGLLIEEQRTNLLTYSSDWSNAAWSKTNITVTAASTMSPDGSVNAQKLAATAAASTSITQGAVVAATSATYTIYVKQGTGATTANTFGIRNVTSATNLVFFTFNYATGAIAYSVGTTGASATAVGNGWWRIQISATTGITSGDSIIVYVGWTGGGAAAGDFLYAYGAQLEAGAFATSYIPTVASQVTRSADNATMVGANFSNWYNPNEGTLFTSASQPTIFASSRTASSVNDSGTNRFNIYRQAGGGINGFMTPGAGAIASGVLATANTPWSAVLAYTTTTGFVSVNGSAVATAAHTVPLGILNNLCIGNVAAAASETFNGHIRSVSYYNTRLVNADLQTLTAPTTTPSLSLDFMTQVFNVG